MMWEIVLNHSRQENIWTKTEHSWGGGGGEMQEIKKYKTLSTQPKYKKLKKKKNLVPNQKFLRWLANDESQASRIYPLRQF
jgi:hypothetical protein